MALDNSILNVTKRLCRLAPEDTDFDLDIIVAINTVFADLHQLGVGTARPFEIEDETKTWDEFIGNSTSISSVKTYMAHRVRLIFDPPTTGPAIAAVEKQIKEHEWRLMEASDQERTFAPSSSLFTSVTSAPLISGVTPETSTS